MSRITTPAATLLAGAANGLVGVVVKLVSSLAVTLLLVCLAGWYGYKAGNLYGPYAEAYKAIVVELDTKNRELEKMRHEDEQALALAEAQRNAAVDAAKGLKTCAATKGQAAKINAVKE